MSMTPHMYHRIVRPRWFTRKYIHDPIRNHFSLKNKTVIDFGCGTGANCPMCDPDHYFGIDPDADRVHFAKKLYPNHTFMVFDEKRIPLPDRTADLIFIVAVLHHIPDELIAGYLREFRRVLKSEGYLVVIEPYLSPSSKLNNWFMRQYDDGEYIRNEDEYMRLFKNGRYDTELIQKFRKCLLYNEILFAAAPQKE